MPRIPRSLIIENKSFFHITWKCHNNDFLLKEPFVKNLLYELLKRYKQKFGIKIFGYCFMDNHPHIVGYCETVENLSHYFQIVNSILARRINQRSGRKGQVVMDRFHSPQIQSEKHLLNVLHYVDLNPVRAGMCKKAADYRWSSHAARLGRRKDDLLDPLPEGLGLTHEMYQEQHEYCLRRGHQKITITRKDYFIGNPHWVARRKREVFNNLFSRRLSSLSSTPTGASQ